MFPNDKVSTLNLYKSHCIIFLLKVHVYFYFASVTYSYHGVDKSIIETNPKCLINSILILNKTTHSQIKILLLMIDFTLT